MIIRTYHPIYSTR